MATTLTHHVQSVHKYYYNRPKYCSDALPTARERGQRISVWDRVHLQGSRSSNSSVWQRLGPAPTKPKVTSAPKFKHHYFSNHVLQKNITKPAHSKLDHHTTKYSSAALASTISQRSRPVETKSSPILKSHEMHSNNSKKTQIASVQKMSKLVDKVALANIKKSGCNQSSSRNATPESPLKPPHIKSTPVLRHQKAADIHESIKEVKHDNSKVNVKILCCKRKATDINTEIDSQDAQQLKRLRAIQAYNHNHIDSTNAGMKKRKRIHLMQPDNMNYQDEEITHISNKRPWNRSFEGQQLNHLTESLAGRIQDLHI